MPIVNLPDGKQINFPDGTSVGEMEAAIASLGPQQQEQTKISPIRAFNEAVINSATFGLKPAAEAAGAKAADVVRGFFGKGDGKTYDDYLVEAKRRDESASEQNPISSGLGSVVGIFGGGAPTKAASLVSQPLKKMVAEGAILGSGLTGAQQALTTEGSLEEKAKAGAKWAIVGGTLGGAIPLAITGITKTPSIVRDGASRIKNLFSKRTPEDIAAINVGKILERDGGNLNLSMNENLLKQAGRGAVERAESIATRGGESADRISKYAYGRSEELPSELSSILGDRFKEGNYPVMLESIKKIARERAKPAYEEAYNAVTKINDPEINKIINRIVDAGDWPTLTNEARKIAAYEGKTLGNIENGLITSYSTKDLDYMTRALRDLGQATEGMGAMGGKTPIGSMRSKAASEIRSRLGEINPSFGNAVKQYGDDIQVYTAAELGKSANIFGSNAKAALNEYNKLPNDIAKQAWRIGQAENLHTMIMTNPSSALKRFNSPMFKKTMGNFYNQNELSSIINSLNKRLKESGSLQRVLGNSRTAARLSQQADDAALLDGGLGQLSADLVKSGPVGSIKKRAGQYLEDKFVNTPLQQKADKYVTDVLLSSPFSMAGKAATGGLPPQVVNALLKTNGAMPRSINTVNPINTRAISGLLTTRTPFLLGSD